MRKLIILLMILTVPASVFALGESFKRIGPMDVIKFKSGTYEIVGYIVEEDDESVTIIPEKGGRLKIPRKVIGDIQHDAKEPKWISADEMVEGFTSQLLKLVEERSSFRVAKVTDKTVYLNTGKGKMDRTGWKANVYREGGEIVDPVTGDTLGREKQLVGTIQIVGEAETYSEALPVDTTVDVFREGDVGVFLRKKPTLVIANLTTVDGTESPFGKTISEGIIGKLSKSEHLTVVEPNQIGTLADELARQNAALDQTPSALEGQAAPNSGDSMLSTMQKLKADAVLVGTVGAAPREETATSENAYGDSRTVRTTRGSVSIRILDTKTGAVLYGGHYLVTYVERESYDGANY
ncbi:MAG: hypothetical protein Kow0099_22670 [Candidatus Abyssubacteria bacterium]